MWLKTKLTGMAVDAATSYAKEQLEKLKQLDLDHDGQRDVDHIKAMVSACAVSAKEALASTNFSNIATGWEQTSNGLKLMRASVDGAKWSATGKLLIPTLKKFGQLLELGVKEVKEERTNGRAG